MPEAVLKVVKDIKAIPPNGQEREKGREWENEKEKLKKTSYKMRKLQDAQAAKLTSSQTNKLDKLTNYFWPTLFGPH